MLQPCAVLIRMASPIAIVISNGYTRISKRTKREALNFIMEDPKNISGPLTVIVTWLIRKGREKEFEAWHHELTDAALAFPGHLGVNVIRTSGAGQEFVVIFRFDTYEHLRAWQKSDIHRALMKKAEPVNRYGSA